MAAVTITTFVKPCIVATQQENFFSESLICKGDDRCGTGEWEWEDSERGEESSV
jgi:hypothetical protein